MESFTHRELWDSRVFKWGGVKVEEGRIFCGLVVVVLRTMVASHIFRDNAAENGN